MQLWWGNNGKSSSLRFEYCVTEPSTIASDVLRTLEAEITGGSQPEQEDATTRSPQPEEEAFRLLSDAEVAQAGCAWTTDLSGLFEEHSAPRLQSPGPEVCGQTAFSLALSFLLGRTADQR